MRMILSRRGIGVLPMVLGLSVASVITATIISQMSLESFRKAAAGYSEWETNLANQKALSIGAFLVAHNMILCRQDGWKENGNPEQKCRWGGNLLPKPIEKSSFGIRSEKYDSNNEYVLSMRNEGPYGDQIDTVLKLKLVKWADDANLRNIVGEIPIYSAYSDDDEYMVLLTASSDMAVGENNRKTITKMGAIRRPMPTPNIQVITTGRETCLFQCDYGAVLTPNPECRGELKSPASGGNAAVTVRIKNLGPGAMYQLQYERTTEYNRSVVNRAPKVGYVNAMNQTEVFLPGQTYESELERECYSPIVTNSQTITEVTVGNREDEGTRVVTTTSLRNLSKEYFRIKVAKFDVEKAQTIENFNTTYNPRDASTYPKNESQSLIEPKRLGVELPTVEVDSPQETRTSQTVITRARVETGFSGDGDGDGDN